MLPNASAKIDMLSLSRADSYDIEIPRPNGLHYFPFQKAGIVYASQCVNTLIGDPPGVGKTIQAIGYMNLNNIDQALIVCNVGAVAVWKRELSKWHCRDLRVEVYHPKTFKPGSCDILILSYYWASLLGPIKQVLKDFSYKLCIIDEVHFLKNPKAVRTKHVLAKNGLISKARNVLALSGTPLVNRPIELYPILKSLAHDAIDKRTYFEYGLEYCAGFQDGRGHWNFEGASNLGKLGQKLRQNFMVRRKKEDVLKSLPPLVENIVYLDPDPASKRAVAKLQNFSVDTVIVKGAGYKLDQMSEARRELGIAKVIGAVEHIKSLLQSGHEKIVVFAHHKDVINRLVVAFEEFGTVAIRGGDSVDSRANVEKRFQTDPSVRVFVGSILAAGVSITLTAASYVVIVEPSWVPGENEQARDRCRRIGQESMVIVDYLAYEGSLDDSLLKSLIKKQIVINEVLA